MSYVSPIRALGLCSGGLDSILSILILKRAGIVVECVGFETPFFSAEKARKAAAMTGTPITVLNITGAYVKMLKNPRFGYGRQMNPCLDCRVLMLNIAGGIMRDKGFNFIFTGEVLGQRPMSQTINSLRCTEKAADLNGYILRPLSARLLSLTVPEEKGWIDREAMLAISGRSRKTQIGLAQMFGVTDYPPPAGGCLLTDPGFSCRLKDLFVHQAEHAERDFFLLKIGRHFRFDKSNKVVIGRMHRENEELERLGNIKGDLIIKTVEFPGPVALIPYGANAEAVEKASLLCAAYGKAFCGKQSKVHVSQNGHSYYVLTQRAPIGDFKRFMI